MLFADTNFPGTFLCTHFVYSKQVFLNLNLPRCTLGQQYQYLVATLNAKIGLNIIKSDNWRHPRWEPLPLAQKTHQKWIPFSPFTIVDYNKFIIILFRFRRTCDWPNLNMVVPKSTLKNLSLENVSPQNMQKIWSAVSNTNSYEKGISPTKAALPRTIYSRVFRIAVHFGRAYLGWVNQLFPNSTAVQKTLVC